MSGNEKKVNRIKESFKKVRNALIILFKIIPILGFIFALFMLISGKAHSLGVPTAGWVSVIGCTVALLVHIYMQVTLPHSEQGFVSYSSQKQIVIRFIIREVEFVSFSLVAFPAIGIMIDRLLGLGKFLPTPYNWLGLLVFVPAGLSLLRTAWVFVSQGKGTPVPYEATQHLVTEGPYRYLRNPMELSLTFLMGGIGIILASYFGIFLFFYTFMVCHLYTKGVEEDEMEARFGQEWLEYKARVPRWIPRIPKTQKS